MSHSFQKEYIHKIIKQSCHAYYGTYEEAEEQTKKSCDEVFAWVWEDDGFPDMVDGVLTFENWKQFTIVEM